MFLPFSFCFSFFFSRVLKICGGTPGFLGVKCTFWAGFICFVLARRHFSLWNSGWWSGSESHMVGGGWVESYLRTRIARSVPSVRRLTHLSPVSSSQFYKYLSLLSRKLVLAGVARRSLAVPSRVAPLFSLLENAHSEKVCSSPREKTGSRLGGSRNSPGNNEQSEKALWTRENHTFVGGSPVFSRKVYILKWSIFVALLGGIPIFLWENAHSLSCSFIFFHVLTFSFIFFHFLQFFLSFSFIDSSFCFSFFFVLEILFCIDCLTISYSSSYVKSIFGSCLGG